jgi:replicative superfamily II helicase
MWYESFYEILFSRISRTLFMLLLSVCFRWAFRKHPGSKVVYIAPMKALVRERVEDWNRRLTGPMKKNLVELTGDVTPDLKTIEHADIIITTPEKWDGISRNWQSRSYVQKVSLVIIDEIHLLGTDCGPILEVIVSCMNYIGSQLDTKVRIVGLSTLWPMRTTWRIGLASRMLVYTIFDIQFAPYHWRFTLMDST